MGKTDKTLTDDLSSASVSRRSFMKGAAALGAMASLYGCSKDGAEEIIYGNLNGGGNSTSSGSDDIYYTENPVYRYGTSAHNCGGRCIIKAQVTPDGRIVRFLTDESTYTENGMGKVFDPEEINSPQFRACARCRSYKGRLYHPGRLKYPLKQTKKRGDVTGFQRISWEQALSEIAARLKAVQGKYGVEALHAIYACGNIYSVYQSASYNGVFKSNDALSPAMRLLGGATAYTSDYSFHQVSYAGGWYGPAWNGFNMDGNVCIKPTTDTLAYGYQKYVVLWGANTPTTHNPLAYPWVKGMEEMRKKGGKVIFIGPEFSEIAVSQADEWIRIKPYTDSALVLGMLYHMLDLTIDSNGQVTNNGLDLDYIDTMVYGFFESPAYWINKTDGTITISDPGGDTHIKVDEVPAGKSLADYILGNDTRLTKVNYNTATNYTAKQYGDKMRGSGSCSYTVKGQAGGTDTEYLYKKAFNTPKTPAWASEITGVPEEKIKELAEMYLDAMKNKHRIWNEWAGGLQKQAEGVSSIMAIQNLCILTKTWGYRGNGFMNQGINPIRTANENQLTNDDISTTMGNSWNSAPAQREHPMPSVAQWHNAIKFAFGDELKTNGYTPSNIYDWDGVDGATATGHAYLDDGGVKALVKRTVSASGTAPTYTVSGTTTATYYDYDGRNNSTTGGGQTNSGFRFILNTGGNIPVNQHPNSIDLSKMYEFLPTYGYGEFPASSMADAFYMVTFDNFMSPSARYSDYVLPAKTTWEQEDFKYLDESDGTNLYIDNVIDGPGESKSTWDFARDLIKACGGNAGTFTGGNEYTTFKDVMQDTFKTKSSSGQGYFAGKTWEEFLEKPFITPEYGKTPDTTAESNPTRLRSELETYLNGGNKATQPFIKVSDTVSASNTILPATHNTHYGFGKGQYADPSTCPNIAYRFMVYMPQLQWCYENAYSKWHGHLPADKRGQNNKDKEGDLIAYPITMYFNYEDYFAESYGVTREELTRENGYFLMTTTHDRFRAHSSQAENPYLRELTHRVIGGALYSGNDSGAYAVSDGSDVTYPAINSLIGADGKPVAGQEKRASYTDIWVNNEDFKDFRDGELVKVYNKVGAVYCTLRKTSRCVPGFVGLHQGCWYDPRTIGGQTVDVGGNCNTLMASRPSRYDHGNAAQSAMVKIERV